MTDKILRILLIDDNPDDRALAMRELRQEFPGVRVDQIADRKAYERALKLFDHDLVITDYHLGWENGLKILCAVKDRAPDCPVIMFTGTGSEQIAADAMKAGLSDYVLKSSTHLAGAAKQALDQSRQFQALREAETRYRDLFEGVPVGLCRITSEGRFLEANPALVRIAGCPDLETLLSRNASDFLVDGEERPRWRELMEAGKEIRDVESRGRKLDGTPMWIRIHARAVRNDRGKVLYYEGVVKDVTETKRSEEEIRQNDTRFQLIARAINDVIWDWDLAQDTLWWNENFKKMFGYQKGEIEPGSESWIKRIHPEDKDGVVSSVHEVIDHGGRFWEREYRFRRRDGSYAHIFDRGYVIRDGQGKPLRMVGAMMDFTERRRAEQALRDSETHLRAIIDTEPECVKLMDANGKLLQMNAAGLAMIEADSAAEVIGRPVLGIVVASYREGFRAFSDSVIRGNKATFEFEIVGLKGTHRWLESHAVPLKSPTDGSPLLLSVTRDITERKRTEERLSFLAHYDSLTGLPNRTLFSDRLQQAMIEANRHDRLVGVLFLDLDRFKNINDSLGHDVGDMLLKGVAERLNGAVRKGDTVARLSGDEFTLVLADMAHVDDAVRVAHKILEIFEQPFRILDRELHVTASLGITLYPFDDRDINGLLRNADVAMYRAKEAGRNTYQFYAAEMTSMAQEHLALENDLRRVLERNELFLEYQPIVDCRHGGVIGMEALVRWNHGKRGLIMPNQFIPLAEETGLIVSIGEWVLRTACAQCRVWQKNGNTNLRMAVNLSARQFQQPKLAEIVERILLETGLEPRSLELEITESVLIHKSETTASTLRKLNNMKVALAIDDFGTGYSSLSYLKRFPIDALKIDQSFVRDIPSDTDDSAIAAAIINMAHSLGIRVIAEGVETKEQLAFMREHRCDAMQGYYFSNPAGPEEITRILHEGKRLEPNG
ncbi:MAG: hypothetical protein Tsb0026_03240 [Sulfuricaulis sp.]